MLLTNLSFVVFALLHVGGRGDVTCDGSCDAVLTEMSFDEDQSASFIQSSYGVYRMVQDLQSRYACKSLPMHEEQWERVSGGFALVQDAETSEIIFRRELPHNCRRLQREAFSERSDDTPEDIGSHSSQLSMLDVGALALIPYPASVKQANDPEKLMELSPDTRLVLKGINDTDFAVQQLRTLIAGLPAAHHNHLPSITVELQPERDTGAEGYELTVHQEGVLLTAATSTGIFYGTQTLRQLVKANTAQLAGLPGVTIRDEPYLQWRGLHLDVSRHFFGVQEVKKLLDTMASFKFNRFHWHLTDDQGWRLPVEGYPKLTQIGSNGVTRGAYTVEEIKDVVAYAKERHIMVLPEVDIPGHNAAAIAAYNELGNSDIPRWTAPERPPTTWGVHPYTLSPSNASLLFLQAVFDQVHDLFPDTFVHIGGDEAPTTQWSESPHARSMLQDSGDRHMQSFFNRRLAGLLAQRGRTFVGWDEVQGMEGLPDDAVIMAWRSSNELRKAARAGKRVVNADQGKLYFDHYQGSKHTEPKAFGEAVTTLKDVYENDPVPVDLTQEQKKMVIGTQGQLWSEYLPKWDHVEYMAHPRSLALAERAWTKSKTTYAQFLSRLKIRLADLDEMGVNYRKLDK